MGSVTWGSAEHNRKSFGGNLNNSFIYIIATLKLGCMCGSKTTWLGKLSKLGRISIYIAIVSWNFENILCNSYKIWIFTAKNQHIPFLWHIFNFVTKIPAPSDEVNISSQRRCSLAGFNWEFAVKGQRCPKRRLMISFQWLSFVAAAGLKSFLSKTVTDWAGTECREMFVGGGSSCKELTRAISLNSPKES